MLEHLSIKNVALIENAEVDFTTGLNILSGETGSGKSMVINALNFLFGEKAEIDFIRNGENVANVSGVFFLESSFVKEQILELGITIKNNCIKLSRTILGNAKSTCKINDKVISIGTLKEVSKFLADIHSQHEHQMLMSPSKQIIILDKFCGDALIEVKEELSKLIFAYKDIIAEINALSSNSSNKEAILELLSFQIKEIESAELKENEDKILIERRTTLLNVQKISENISKSLLLISYSEQGMSASEQISKACSLISDIKNTDQQCKNLAESLENILVLTEELSIDLKSYEASLSNSEFELDEIEKRLDVIYSLKKKYGKNTDEIFEFYEKSKEKLDTILGSEERISYLNNEKKKYLNEIRILCQKLSDMRKIAAKKITEEVSKNLTDLGMTNAKFEITVERKKEFGLSGFDKAEFMISANMGEPLKPLAKVASGGEMSRVMLALKTVIADSDVVDTLILDEIDTGVSGRTAQQVAEKLSVISKKNQVICITHLPQIAAMGDNHLIAEKITIKDRTISNVFLLGENESIEELARLLGGAKITEATLNAAKEMRELALNIKKQVL